ncbi:MAG TPA: hypothetical protein VGO61_07085 [Steroidobacteraceae bacterium]|jgi:hypothetical protein|nr:hypothetical protein [Steroidobacteraceae bacterium]
MNHRSIYVIALILASGAVFAGVYLANLRGEPAAAAPVPVPAATQSLAAAPAAPAISATPTITPDTVARWIADTASADAGKRATAIAALADAPRADALPVLRRILTDGEPQVDRPLALRSLRELALAQGDKDGAIRDAVRHAIYHGDDQTNTAEAQDVLDTIEESEQK